MRIISGSAGGLSLEVPKNVTRPTQDKVRQAVFSMLGEVDGLRVLDLFAGSGALGLECLSRGAADATFVDADRGAAEVIRRNLAKARFPAGTVRQGDVFKVLGQLAACGNRYDLAFADPPYANAPGDPDLAAQLAAHADFYKLMAPGGSVILESRVTKGGSASTWSPWEVVRDREYGSTRILWLRKPLHVEQTVSAAV